MRKKTQKTETEETTETETVETPEPETSPNRRTGQDEAGDS